MGLGSVLARAASRLWTGWDECGLVPAQRSLDFTGSGDADPTSFQERTPALPPEGSLSAREL